MNAWWLFTNQASAPPREPLVPKRRSCAWCGVMLTGPCNQKYCSEQCSTRSQYIKKAAKKAAAQRASVG